MDSIESAAVCSAICTEYDKRAAEIAEVLKRALAHEDGAGEAGRAGVPVINRDDG